MIKNGEPNHCYEGFGNVDRIIELPGIDLEFFKTKNGGWEEYSTFGRGDTFRFEDNFPTGRFMKYNGAGHALNNLIKNDYNYWVVIEMWRRIMELEDELHILKKAIIYKG